VLAEIVERAVAYDGRVVESLGPDVLALHPVRRVQRDPPAVRFDELREARVDEDLTAALAGFDDDRMLFVLAVDVLQ
jgi:hypothetical protein